MREKECKSCKWYREDRYRDRSEPEVGSCLKSEVGGIEKHGFQAAAWNESAWLAVRPDFGCKGWEIRPFQYVILTKPGIYASRSILEVSLIIQVLAPSREEAIKIFLERRPDLELSEGMVEAIPFSELTRAQQEWVEAELFTL